MVKGRDVVLIRNPIPKLFSILPIPPQMPPKAIRIAFVSENLLNPYKGFEILVSALNKVPREFEVELILIGRGRIHLTIPNIKVVQKYCTSASEVAIEIGKCSVLVVPSIQDNSPSVISESLMCGIPVIGAAVGGITEILQEFGMPIFPAGDADELASSIVNFQSVNTIETARKAREMFSYENIATQYSNLYASMISNL
jgi:glycosyltransferase involved in cell wall biosynthesis